ncbi:MAG TPA: helix-turn-helix domain-containing protein [Nitrososphaerales archaeon]|nr:helix-turn-helix domain-containing protein [Nitrososphaerales archaeon]
MSAPNTRPQNLDDILSKPNRAAIIRTIGDRGELSFKDLKANMKLGVGTLYYHLDGLSGLVSQNSSKQYILTEQGKQVYEAIRGMAQVKETRRVRLPSLRAVLGEVLLFDSHVERLPVDSMSDISITVGILLTASVLAGMTRIDDVVFFILGRAAPPASALVSVLASWLLLFLIGSLLVMLLWRSSVSLAGMAGGSALSLVPVMFAMALEGLRRSFAPSLAFLNHLYVGSGYLVFQAALVVWGAYIYTVSVRSASSLNLEKTLVVALLVVLVNLGYLWGRPLIFPAR